MPAPLALSACQLPAGHLRFCNSAISLDFYWAS